MPIYKTLNKHFFKKWNREMAYVLGFFAADGTMIRNNRGAHFIEFHITDRIILEKLKIIMGSNHKISKRKKKEKAHRIGYRLQLGSKDMFSDLIQLGFMPNKSLILHFPKVPGIYLGDFVRGYFDGDGCVYFKKHWVKDRKKMKWVFTTRFTSGSESFLKDLFIHLKKFGLNGGFIVTKYHNSGYELVYSHKDSLALFQSMYHNVTHNLFLPRKYKLFKKAVQILFNKS